MSPPSSLLVEVIVLLFVPLFATGAVLHGWRTRWAQKQGRKPVSEKLLRPPGEWLRLRIDLLLEAFDDQLTLLLGVAVATAAVYAVYAPGEAPASLRARCWPVSAAPGFSATA